ncbi:apolipoprotein N-acyltransferase [Spirochaetota bacterium]
MERMKLIDILKKRVFLKIVLALISSIMLVLAYPGYSFNFLVWIGFVPILWAIEDASYGEVFWLSTLMGAVAFSLGYPWLNFMAEKFMGIPFPFSMLALFAYSVYHAQVFSLILLSYTYLKRNTGVSHLFLFPALTVALWSVIPTIFSFNLGNASTGFLVSLQAIEVLGVSALDFVIAMTNVLIYRILIYGKIKIGRWSIAAAIAVIAIWFSYGYIALNSWDSEVKKWKPKKIGIVQPHRPASHKILPPEEGYTIQYPLEMGLSVKLALQKPDIIIWPEGNYFGYHEDVNIRFAFLRTIKSFNIPMIIHDYPSEVYAHKTIYRNSSMWMKKDGTFGEFYHKRHLVPFGEYIPIIDYDNPFIKFLNLPPPVTPGVRATAFKTAGMIIQPMICYEIAFSDLVAETIGKKAKGKVIVLQSNDGWYGKGAQPYQHNSFLPLRAIENRVSVVHVINNGPSSIVLPSGRRHFLSDFWKRGTWAVEMPYNPDSGGAFFSRYPNLFLYIIQIILLIIFVYHLYGLFQESRRSI